MDQLFKLTPSRRSYTYDSAIAIARNPAKLNESLTDCGAECSRNMIASLSPIETTARQAPLFRSQLIYIDAPLFEKLLASRRHVKIAVAICTRD